MLFFFKIQYEYPDSDSGYSFAPYHLVNGKEYLLAGKLGTPYRV